MMRFIYFCMAFLVLSFVGVPIYNGVSEERAGLTQLAATDEAGDDSMSFEEIYALADEGQSADPASLNDISPAAGNGNTGDAFSRGFTNREDSALADTPVQETEEAETAQ